MVVSPERAASAQQVCHHDTVGSTVTCCCWLRGVRGYDARIWRICDAAAALLFVADAVVVDAAAAAAAASRSDGRPTDGGGLPEFGDELDRFVSAKCAACVIVSTFSPPKIYLAHKIQDTCPRASLICIFPGRRAGRWSWVVVTGAGCWSRSLDGRRADTRRHVPLGGGEEASGTHSLRSRGDRDCDYDRGRGADRRYFREGHFLVGTPSPQASPTNYNLIYIAGSPGPLYLGGRDGGLRRVQRTSLPRR